MSSAELFEVGKTYSRDEVRSILGLGPMNGGHWATGYVQYKERWFIFANIETAGRTGHNYGNRWVDGRLEWFGKTNSSLQQNQIRSMLADGSRVHIFAREDSRNPFVYHGLGRPYKITDSSPVGVTWDILPVFAVGAESLAEEIHPSEIYSEGSVREIKVNVYERDPDARKACIRHYGSRCCICSFDFGSNTYC